MTSASSPQTVHATCVSVGGRAVLIKGASGSGKSSLGLQLLAMGAGLVADDRTLLHRQDDHLIADVPQTIKGLIEARGVGILRVPAAGPVPVALVIDLDQPEPERLPHRHLCTLQGITLPCLYNASSPHFAAAILQYLHHDIIHPS